MSNVLFCDLSIQAQCQVPVEYGERMEHGKVAETCEKAGLKAVCWGDETCSVNKDDSR